mgnify:CR=1 FL=1
MDLVILINKLKKSIAIIVSIFYFFSSSVVAAQTTSSTITGSFTILKKNELALFDGVLFDSNAIAVLLTDKEYIENSFKLKLDYELKIQKSNSDLELNELKLSCNTQKNIDNDIISFKDKELKEIRKIALEKSDNSLLYLGVGIVGGIILTLLSVYITRKVVP